MGWDDPRLRTYPPNEERLRVAEEKKRRAAPAIRRRDRWEKLAAAMRERYSIAGRRIKKGGLK